MLQVLNLGAGVQSTALLLMACRGELPTLDAAVFADTGWEPAAVYAHLEWLTGVASDAGIPVHVVSAGNLRDDSLRSARDASRFASMPFYTLNPDGSRGLARRQCTREYKIEPIERFLRRELLGLKPRQRAPREAVITQWFGISTDELRRVRVSRNRWSRFAYPLIGLPEPMLPRPYSRQACRAWLTRHYPERDVPRSACIGCPFHSNDEWRQVRTVPDEWADAVAVDAALRRIPRFDGAAFLHADRVPLADVDLRTSEDKGQRALFNDNACDSGHCFT